MTKIDSFAVLRHKCTLLCLLCLLVPRLQTMASVCIGWQPNLNPINKPLVSTSLQDFKFTMASQTIRKTVCFSRVTRFVTFPLVHTYHPHHKSPQPPVIQPTPLPQFPPVSTEAGLILHKGLSVSQSVPACPQKPKKILLLGCLEKQGPVNWADRTKQSRKRRDVEKVSQRTR